MNTYRHVLAAAALSLGGLGAAACHGDYLSGGELTTDPNRPTVVSTKNLIVPIEETLLSFWGGDPARIAGIYTQQQAGLARQYGALGGSYAQDATTTNGAYAALYSAGGLVDIKALEQKAAAAGDSLTLGIAQILEGAMFGTGADLFGDLVYSQALKGTPNPKPDAQKAVYDSVQKVLAAGIANLTNLTPGGTNTGPGSADIIYGGSAASWVAAGHTLRARFYMHTVTVANPDTLTALRNALAEAQKGIASPAGDLKGKFTATPGEQNFYYQFYLQRGGDLGPGPFLDSLLQARKDPRDTAYFSHNKDGSLNDIADARLAPDFAQPFVTYDENLLIWAEAAFRLGDQATALTKLNQERAQHSLPPIVASGRALLNEILIEEYIVDFQLGSEAYTLYRRTCTPNLTPATTAKKIPGRLFYDTSEQQTNTSLAAPGTGNNGYYNALTPPLATSLGTGQSCRGQAGS